MVLPLSFGKNNVETHNYTQKYQSVCQLIDTAIVGHLVTPYLSTSTSYLGFAYLANRIQMFQIRNVEQFPVKMNDQSELLLCEVQVDSRKRYTGISFLICFRQELRSGG